ncbi:MAG: hypothetical protein ACXW32_12730 [Limisphaerales bacterium]
MPGKEGVLKKVCTKASVRQQFSSLADARRELPREFPTDLSQDHFVLLFRLGIATEDQFAPVRGWEMNVKHLFLTHYAEREKIDIPLASNSGGINGIDPAHLVKG